MSYTYHQTYIFNNNIRIQGHQSGYDNKDYNYIDLDLEQVDGFINELNQVKASLIEENRHKLETKLSKLKNDRKLLELEIQKISKQLN